MPKKPLTLERHREIGQQLKQLTDWLYALCPELGQAYGDEVTQLTDHAIATIGKLRWELDDYMFIEQPDLGARELCGIYYGQTHRISDAEACLRQCLDDLRGPALPPAADEPQ